MSGMMGPPPPAGPSRGKRRATSESSISDYASADEDLNDGEKRKQARGAPSLASAGSHQFDAYVHEGDETTKIFVTMVEEAGLKLSRGKSKISLDFPASMFINKVRNFVRRKLREVTVATRPRPDEPEDEAKERLADAKQEFVENVIDGLQLYIEDPLRLHKALVSTVFAKGEKTIEQESLVRMVLQCEELQTCLAKTIIEKMVEVSSVAVSSDMEAIEKEVGLRVNIGQLILQQLQGLHAIADGPAMVEIMKEHFEYLNQADQKQFIVAVPFILMDNDHEGMARYFLELLEKGASKQDYLTVPILDSFSNFFLTPALNEAAMEKVFSIIPSMSFQEIPAAVKFLMASVNGAEGETSSASVVEEMLKKLRRCLDLDSDVGPNSSSTSSSAAASSATQSKRRRLVADEEANKKSAVALILDAMFNGIRMERVVWHAWDAAIGAQCASFSNSVAGSLRPGAVDLDLVVLILLYHHEPAQKAAEKTLKKCVKTGFLTKAVVESVFKLHASVLTEYLKSVVKITNTLIQTAHQNRNIHAFLNALVEEIFASFDESAQQEIVFLLVVAIGNGNAAQKDSAIDTLTHLIKLYVKKVERFTVMIKTLLDHLESFSLSQARKIFSMLGAIAAASSFGREESMLDDIHIIITKQLSSNEFHYKSLAIVGGVSLVWHSKNFQNSAGKLLDTLMISCWSDPRAFALLCDELSMTLKFESEMTLSAAIANATLDSSSDVGQVFSQTQTRQASTHKELINHLHEKVCDLFQNEYCSEISGAETNGTSASGKVTASLSMDKNLCYQVPLNDKDMDTNLYIPLLEMITKGFVGLRDRFPVEASILSPLFRLLCLLEQRKSRALEEIDAVLICPVSLPAEAVHQRFDELSLEKKNAILSSWFHCANWFRELLNGFSGDSGGCQKSMGHRLRALTHLNMLLLQALNSHVKFEAPYATFDVADKTLKPPKVSSGGTGGKGKKSAKTAKKMTKKKMGEVCEQLGDSDEENKTNNVNGNKSNANADGDKEDLAKERKNLLTDLSHYKPAFRELDMEVFNLLVRKCEISGGNEATSSGLYLTLKPQELLFLLEDLVMKIAFKLPAPSLFGARFGRASNAPTHRNLEMTPAIKVWKKIAKLIPFICNHMEDISAYYQEPRSKTKPEANDLDDSLQTQTAFVDSVDRFTEDGLAIRTCFKHLFACLNGTFGWAEASNNRSHLQEVFENIASKIAAGSSTAASTQKAASEALEGTFRYFTNYAESLPSLECAVELIKLLKNICAFGPRQSMRKRFEERISKLCREFLSREWLGPDRQKIKGMQRLKDLEFLADNFICQSEDEIAATEELTTHGLGDVIASLTSQGRDDAAPATSKTFASIDKSSFPVIFRSVLKNLASLARDTHTRFNEDTINLDELFEEWTLSTRIIHQNFTFLKSFDPARITMACIRHGHTFLEVFLKHALPVFSKVFHEKSQQIMSLLKTLQQVTRVMNHLCGHSKLYKDQNLMKFVPKMKRTLEAFVCQVRVLMTKNRCSEAMWMGNLKNRDLQGQEILSQSQATSVDEDESRADAGDEEELPNLDKPNIGNNEDDEDEEEGEQEEEDEDEDDENDDEGGTNSLSDVF